MSLVLKSSSFLQIVQILPSQLITVHDKYHIWMVTESKDLNKAPRRVEVAQ
jgi:hypothetical protein